MMEEEKRKYREKKQCNLCISGYFNTNQKVADHYHLSGKFRLTLCNTCNWKFSNSEEKYISFSEYVTNNFATQF